MADEQLIREECPWFLRCPSSEDGLTGLWRFMHQWFGHRPPKLLPAAIKFRIVEHLRELIDDIYVHLTEDDCRRLRQYRAIRGRPFGVWLSAVTFMWLAAKLRDHWEPLADDLDELLLEGLGARKSLDPAWHEAVRVVSESLKTLTPYQRLLIVLRAHEWKPREIPKMVETDGIGQSDIFDPFNVFDVIELLIQPRKAPIQIANDTRYALRKLRRRVEQRRPGLYKELFGNHRSSAPGVVSDHEDVARCARPKTATVLRMRTRCTFG